MPRHLTVVVFLIFAILLFTSFAVAAGAFDAPSAQNFIDNPWSKVKSPTSGQAQSIGSYAEGCIRGAIALPDSGEGFQTMHPSRHRLFGHPDLINFITRFSKEMYAKNKTDVVIGDLGQPRGGPTLTGHASHQTGLDVDIWLWQPAAGRILSPSERENISSTRYVVEDFEKLESVWQDSKLELLKTAALEPQVQRIFINPVIKRQACRLYPGQTWLQKLRPWWSHDDHFHVRLFCPVGDTGCEPQAAVAAGTGCDASLDDWFTPETKAKAKQMREHPTPAEMPTLPKLCKKVLTEN